jgi:dipeptidyl-peptidase-4
VLPWHLEEKLHHIPFDSRWTSDGKSFEYSIRAADGVATYRIDAATGRKERKVTACPASAERADGVARSPDGRWALRVRDGNLLRVEGDGAEVALTTDGEPDFAYAATPDSDLYSVTRTIAGTESTPVGVWSPDGTKFLTYRVDQRRVRVLPMVQSIVPGETHQIPRLHAPRVALPGDEHVTRAHFVIVDVSTAKVVNLDVPAGILADSDPAPVTNLQWSASGAKVYVLHEERGYKTLRYFEVDAATGSARQLVSETAELPIRGPGTTTGPGAHVGWPLQSNGRVIWYSERDGWGHLYLYRDGRMIRRITSGSWLVHSVVHVDEAGGLVYFIASGKEPQRDPYQRYLYRVRLDGSRMELLTPEPADHTVTFAPRGESFVDTFSTADAPPVTTLRSPAGRLLATLERGDASALHADGWRPPERFSVLAADGRTPLYGNLYRPSHFDAGRRYPLLDSIYHGSHIATAPVEFELSASSRLAQPTAELGFVVMILDARGTGGRGREFQDLSYGGGFASPDAIADHIAAARQLAERHPYLDLSRVGIYGHSWGGYRAARAMFQFPDFYKAAVASAGSHDNFLYVNSHELWFGMPAEAADDYREQSNLPLAGRLKGRLLLAHGDVDDSVHPAQTLQMAHALIEANKDFDLLILPGRNHDLQFDPYFVRRRWDYLVQHVMGEAPPREFPIRAAGE